MPRRTEDAGMNGSEFLSFPIAPSDEESLARNLTETSSTSSMRSTVSTARAKSE
jgi:hypothetical protein